jgi:hypothetical protein
MTGRQTAAFIAAWAAGLAVLAAVAFIWERDRLALAELPAAVVGTLVLAAGAAALRDRDRLEIPDASVGTAALGLGLTLLGTAAAVGLWLVFLGAPVVVLGLVALALERRP